MALNLETELLPAAAHFEPPPEDSLDRDGYVALLAPAFRLWNTVGSTAAYISRPNVSVDTREADFNPFPLLEGTHYAEGDRASLFIDVRTRADFERVKLSIDRDIDDWRHLDQSGFSGIAAGITAGILDPINIIPFAKAGALARSTYLAAQGAKAAGIGRGALIVARANLFAEGASQLVFHATQEERTWGQSALDLTGAAVLGGVFGGAAVAAAGTVLRRRAVAEADAVLEHVGRSLDSTGAAGRTDPDMIAPVTPYVVPSGKTLEIEGGLVTKSYLRAVTSPKNLVLHHLVPPAVKILVRSSSDTMGNFALALGNIPGFRVRGFTGGQSVEARADEWMLGMYTKLHLEFKNTYLRYLARLRDEPAPSAQWLHSSQARVAELRRPTGALTQAEFAEAASMAARRWRGSPTAETAVPEAEELADWARMNILEVARREGQAVELFGEELTAKNARGAISYFPRHLVKSRVLANEHRVVQLFREGLVDEWRQDADAMARIASTYRKEIEAGTMTLDDAVLNEAEDIARDSVNKILGASVENVPIGDVTISAGRSFKGRVLPETVTDYGEWEQYLDSDFLGVLSKYLRRTGTDIELARRFGKVEAFGEDRIVPAATATDKDIRVQSVPFQKLKQQVIDEYTAMRDEARKNLTGKKLAKRIKELQRQQAEYVGSAGKPGAIDVLVGMQRGTYGLQPPGFFVSLARAARTYVLATTGGGIVLSQLPELAMQSLKLGMWRSFRTEWAPLFVHMKAFKLAAQESRAYGVGAQMSLDSHVTAMGEVNEDMVRTFAERTIQRASRATALAIGMPQWTTALQRLHSVPVMTRLIETILAVDAGNPIDDWAAASLRMVGLTDPAAIRGIAAQLKAPRGMKRVGRLFPVIFAQTENWTNREAQIAFRSAMRQGVDDIIITPSLHDRLPFTSTEGGKVIFMYQSFAAAANNRLLIPTLQAIDRMDVVFLARLLPLLGMATLVEATKTWNANRELPDTPQEWISAAIDRSGIGGLWINAYNLTARMAGLPQTSSRYISREGLVMPLLGPVVASAEKLGRSMIDISSGDFTKRDLHNARTMLVPFSQVFYLRRLFDTMEASLAAGLPDREKQ